MVKGEYWEAGNENNIGKTPSADKKQLGKGATITPYRVSKQAESPGSDDDAVRWLKQLAEQSLDTPAFLDARTTSSSVMSINNKPTTGLMGLMTLRYYRPRHWSFHGVVLRPKEFAKLCDELRPLLRHWAGTFGHFAASGTGDTDRTTVARHMSTTPR